MHAMQRDALHDVDRERRMNVGIGDNSLRFVTGTVGGDWEVVAWGGRFAVCKFSNERMRITADGQVLFGDTLRTPDNAIEVHWFNTREWAGLARRRMEAIDSIGLPKIIINTSGNIMLGTGSSPWHSETRNWSITQTPVSEWRCYLFGNEVGGQGMVYTPAKGKEPNFVVRWLMKIMLACTWVKEGA